MILSAAADGVGGATGAYPMAAPAYVDALADAITASMARRAAVASPPTHALLRLWEMAHRGLPSFACDFARAERLLAFAPTEGPHAGVAFGDRDPLSFTPLDADLWRAHRGAMTTRLGRGPAPATINRELMMLVRVLNFAVSRRTIPHNPLAGEDVFDEEDNAREVVIDEAGFAEIVRRLPNVEAVAYVTLAYDSAMRRTEVALCRRSWWDVDRGLVRVPGAVAKNGQPRRADLTDRARAACDPLPRDLLFASHPRWLYELFNRAVLASDVRGPSGEVPIFHDLRRSWVTLARRRGIPESEIMAKSGHLDHAVFRRYSIVGEEDLQRSRQRMEDGRRADLAALRARRGPHMAPGCGMHNSKTGTASR